MSRPFLARILTPEECSTELSTILEAKWLSLRSLPAPEPDNARVAREAAEAYDREAGETFVAFDLTLRCRACGSNVDKTGGVVHCFTCQRGKP